MSEKHQALQDFDSLLRNSYLPDYFKTPKPAAQHTSAFDSFVKLEDNSCKLKVEAL